MTENKDATMRAATMPMAQKIRMARVEAGLTQPQLSELTGIAQGNLSNIERGKVQCRADTADRIFAAITQHLGHKPTILEASEGTLGIVGRTAGKLLLVDAMAEPKPVEWLAEGFLARRFVTMIAGQEGAGKSAVTQTLAVALARGNRNALGMRLPGTHCRGLILDAENVMVADAENVDGSLAQDRLQRFGLTDENAALLTVAGSDGFDLDKDYDALDGALNDLRVDFLILDSFTSLWFGNENNGDEVGRVLRKLNRLAVKHNIGILLIHHTNKAGDAYRGHSAIGATIAAVFTFARVIRKDEDTGKKVQHPTLRMLAPYKVRIAAEPRAAWLQIGESGVYSTQDTEASDWDVEDALSNE